MLSLIHCRQLLSAIIDVLCIVIPRIQGSESDRLGPRTLTIKEVLFPLLTVYIPLLTLSNVEAYFSLLWVKLVICRAVKFPVIVFILRWVVGLASRIAFVVWLTIKLVGLARVVVVRNVVVDGSILCLWVLRYSVSIDFSNIPIPFVAKAHILR